jgi:SpoIID/LytB domain protein
MSVFGLQLVFIHRRLHEPHAASYRWTYRVLILSACLLVATLTVSGCIGYLIGEAPMYNPRSSYLSDTSMNAMGESIPKIVVKQFSAEPLLRIGFMEGYEKIDFRISGQFNLTDLDGDPVFSGVNSRLKWRSLVEGGHGATFIYSVLVTACREESEAIELVEKLRRLYPQVRMQRLGGQLVISGEMVNDNTKYRILAGAFETESEAKKLLAKFSDEYAPRIIREKVKDSRGKIEVYDAEYDYSTKLDDGFRIVPISRETTITLYGVKVGSGFQWESMSDRTYCGIVEIRVGNDARLCAVSEIPLDQYLRGVVPAEMPSGYPPEALMAQAVAARSAVLAKLGTKHLNDPYDFCANVHCQVYSGIVSEAESTNDAVTSTGGEVIYFEDNICDAVYSAVCGGHTEHKRNVWNPPDEAYLQGIYDALPNSNDSLNLDLSHEKEVRKWIDERPEVFCALNRDNLPTLLAYSKKYFRWEVSYSRKELEDIIKKRTDEDIGILYDIIPLNRGVSGRLMEIEVLGSRKNIRIKKELNIRRALSPTYLRSAAFVIDIEMGEMGTPLAFHFRGAGWGHGVGMCQIGAAVMALDGYDHRKILAHYYQNVEVRSVYTPEIPREKHKPKEVKRPKEKEKSKVKVEVKPPEVEKLRAAVTPQLKTPEKLAVDSKPVQKPKTSEKLVAEVKRPDKPKGLEKPPPAIKTAEKIKAKAPFKVKRKITEKPHPKVAAKAKIIPKSKSKVAAKTTIKPKQKIKPTVVKAKIKKAIKVPPKPKRKGVGKVFPRTSQKALAVKKPKPQLKAVKKPKLQPKAIKKPFIQAKTKTTARLKAREQVRVLSKPKTKSPMRVIEKAKPKDKVRIVAKTMGKMAMKRKK